jgi:hypothetical protein
MTKKLNLDTTFATLPDHIAAIIALTAQKTTETAHTETAEQSPPPAVAEVATSETAEASPVVHDDQAATFCSDSPHPFVEERCKLKARACRWLKERQELSAEEIRAGNGELFALAERIPNGGCNLWMMRPSCPQVDLDANQTLASCFDLLADAVCHLRRFDESCSHRDYMQALKYAAESQKLVNQQMPIFGRTADPDQLHVFNWLREAASNERIFLPGLRKKDRIAFDRYTALSQDLATAATTVEARKAEHRSRTKLMKKLEHQLTQSAVLPEIEFRDSVFQTLIELTDQLHLPPSNTELRAILMAHLDSLPHCDEDAPQAVQVVYRELDNYLEAVSEDELAITDREWTDDVRTVASLIEGRSVVLVGGTRNRNAETTIIEAFRLGSATWIESDKADSYKDFSASIAPDDVCLVLHLTRFSRHICKIQKLCERLGKPYVRVTGGYNPNNVARNVLQQVGKAFR